MRTARRRRTVASLRVAVALLAAAACSDGPVPPAPGRAALAVAAAGDGPGVPGTAAATAARSARVPAKGRFTGTVESTPDPGDPSVFELRAQAEGITSHLGRVSATWVIPAARIDLAARQLEIVSGPWRATLTGANGDHIVAVYEFRTPAVTFDLAGDFSAAATLVVKGGTGRFRGSTGEGVATVHGNVYTERFTIELDGWGTLGAPR